MKGLYENSAWGKQRAYLTIKWLKESDPHFSQYSKDGENQVFKKVEWQFNRVEFSNYTWTDEKWKEHETEKYTVVLLNEDDEEIHASTSWTSVGRQILNALVSANKSKTLNWWLGTVSISLYMSKRGYPSAYITNQWQPLDWYFWIDELKELTEEETLKDWTKKYYYTKIIEWLKEQAKLLRPSTIEETLELTPDFSEKPTETKAPSKDVKKEEESQYPF